MQAFTAEAAVELDEADEVHGTYLLGRLSCAFRALPNNEERLEALCMIDERTSRTSLRSPQIKGRRKMALGATLAP